MKHFLLLIFFLPFFGITQNTGLYGKKLSLEVQGHGSWPVVTSWFKSRSFYKRQGNGLKAGRNILDAGYRVGVNYAISNQVGIGVEYGMEYQNLIADNDIELGFGSGSFTYTALLGIQHEAVNISTFSIMPKLEFSGRTNLLPIGLSHQLGVGYSSTRILERDYRYEIAFTSSDSLLTPLGDALVNYNDRWTGFTIMYQINMRTPITDMIMISYGLRYTANFVRQTPQFFAPPGQLDMARLIKQKRNETFLQLHIGAALAL